MTIRSNPIGVFDSGMGGLTCVRQLVKLLPTEDIVYLGDTARVPYGNKSPNTIIKFSIQNSLYLLRFKIKLIVVACNTSSSFALDKLKTIFGIPIIGVIEPGVKRALELTKNKRIGIIGTNATINSLAYQKKLIAAGSAVKVFAQSCPLFVPLAEEGWIRGRITEDIAKKYLAPLKNKNIDTLVLGCTHYPLLKSAIAKVMGRSIRLVDSAEELALDVKALMRSKGIASDRKIKGKIRFFLTDEPYKFKKTGERFLGRKLESVYPVKENEF
ncbi:MAG: glutamate racemase [Candidatus Omnitrophica bacterium]|nr:glutamate racemase [Candidatus Omnitrophota bacterium]